MINFRFHLVSLVAVFLALGIGILVGSTVVDQGIVNRLDSEIKSVGKENSARKATSKQLEQQNSQLQQFAALIAPFAGDGRLDRNSIALIAERGIDSGDVKKTEQALQAAGADVPAVLWLDDSWRLDSDSRVQALQSALDLQGSASSIRAAALNLLVGRLTKAPAPPPPPPASTSTTQPTPGTASKASTTLRRGTTTSAPAAAKPPAIDALAALEKAGFISVTDGDASALTQFPSRTLEVLEITGDDSDFAGGDLTAAFVRALVDANVPTAVGAVYDGGGNQSDAPERGASLAPILDDHTLSDAVSTVDDLDLVQGQIASVLTLSVMGSPGNIGHYGFGTGASAPLPPHGS